jgi:hypothetical protein
LQGATCPGLTWQRPESNHGYIELIEGQYGEGNPSILTDGVDDTYGDGSDDELDPALSSVPRNDVVLDYNNNGAVDDVDRAAHYDRAESLVGTSGLGDYDDILMLTVRNEHEPFVGRMPSAASIRIEEPGESPANVEFFWRWRPETEESTLAEVVWFAVENPTDNQDPDNFFGEPGMRTIYRRTLLIAPWVNPYYYVDEENGQVYNSFTLKGENRSFTARPGLVRILRDDIERNEQNQALAALVAFQERFDLSVRLEWDRDIQRWTILANTLADLTKRENRYEHHAFRPTDGERYYPFAAASVGSGYQGSNPAVMCWPDPESPDDPPPGYLSPPPPYLAGRAEIRGGAAVTYNLSFPIPPPPNTQRQIFKWRPFAYVDGGSATLATARVLLNNEEKVVRIIHGFAPLTNERRGEDVMMTGALAFDVRLYDPGAPLYMEAASRTVLSPSDPGWKLGYDADVPNDPPDINEVIGNIASYVGQGAYVDLGYGFGRLIPRTFFGPNRSGITPWYFASPLEIENTQARYRTDTTPGYVLNRGVLSDIYHRYRDRNASSGVASDSQLAPGYAVYDTWSFHYENNGVNEDQLRFDGSNWQPVDNVVDDGTNGLDDVGSYTEGYVADPLTNPRLGPDDVGERETAPPYDKPLRGIQVLMRVYEQDSRAIRQVRVNQHFMPE